MPNRALFDKSKIISDFRKMIELDSMIIANEKITKMIEEYKANKELASTPIIVNENDNKENEESENSVQDKIDVAKSYGREISPTTQNRADGRLMNMSPKILSKSYKHGNKF